MSASIDEVVVLPWLPATAIVVRVATISAERVGAPQHRHAALARGDDLGVALGDGGRDDDGVELGRQVVGACARRGW